MHKEVALKRVIALWTIVGFVFTQSASPLLGTEPIPIDEPAPVATVAPVDTPQPESSPQEVPTTSTEFLAEGGISPVETVPPEPAVVSEDATEPIPDIHIFVPDGEGGESLKEIIVDLDRENGYVLDHEGEILGAYTVTRFAEKQGDADGYVLIDLHGEPDADQDNGLVSFSLFSDTDGILYTDFVAYSDTVRPEDLSSLMETFSRILADPSSPSKEDLDSIADWIDANEGFFCRRGRGITGCILSSPLRISVLRLVVPTQSDWNNLSSEVKESLLEVIEAAGRANLNQAVWNWDDRTETKFVLNSVTTGLRTILENDPGSFSATDKETIFSLLVSFGKLKIDQETKGHILAILGGALEEIFDSDLKLVTGVMVTLEPLVGDGGLELEEKLPILEEVRTYFLHSDFKVRSYAHRIAAQYLLSPDLPDELTQEIIISIFDFFGDESFFRAENSFPARDYLRSITEVLHNRNFYLPVNDPLRHWTIVEWARVINQGLVGQLFEIEQPSNAFRSLALLARDETDQELVIDTLQLTGRARDIYLDFGNLVLDGETPFTPEALEMLYVQSSMYPENFIKNSGVFVSVETNGALRMLANNLYFRISILNRADGDFRESFIRLFHHEMGHFLLQHAQGRSELFPEKRWISEKLWEMGVPQDDLSATGDRVSVYGNSRWYENEAEAHEDYWFKFHESFSEALTRAKAGKFVRLRSLLRVMEPYAQDGVVDYAGYLGGKSPDDDLPVTVDDRGNITSIKVPSLIEIGGETFTNPGNFRYEFSYTEDNLEITRLIEVNLDTGEVTAFDNPFTSVEFRATVKQLSQTLRVPEEKIGYRSDGLEETVWLDSCLGILPSPDGSACVPVNAGIPGYRIRLKSGDMRREFIKDEGYIVEWIEEYTFHTDRQGRVLFNAAESASGLIEQARQDLSLRLEREVDSTSVGDVSLQLWTNSCFDVPGSSPCTWLDRPRIGYKILFDVDGESYTYHTVYRANWDLPHEVFFANDPFEGIRAPLLQRTSQGIRAARAALSRLDRSQDPLGLKAVSQYLIALLSYQDEVMQAVSEASLVSLSEAFPELPEEIVTRLEPGEFLAQHLQEEDYDLTGDGILDPSDTTRAEEALRAVIPYALWLSPDKVALLDLNQDGGVEEGDLSLLRERFEREMVNDLRERGGVIVDFITAQVSLLDHAIEGLAAQIQAIPTLSQAQGLHGNLVALNARILEVIQATNEPDLLRDPDIVRILHEAARIKEEADQALRVFGGSSNQDVVWLHLQSEVTRLQHSVVAVANKVQTLYGVLELTNDLDQATALFRELENLQRRFQSSGTAFSPEDPEMNFWSWFQSLKNDANEVSQERNQAYRVLEEGVSLLEDLYRRVTEIILTWIPPAIRAYLNQLREELGKGYLVKGERSPEKTTPPRYLVTIKVNPMVIRASEIGILTSLAFKVYQGRNREVVVDSRGLQAGYNGFKRIDGKLLYKGMVLLATRMERVNPIVLMTKIKVTQVYQNEIRFLHEGKAWKIYWDRAGKVQLEPDVREVPATPTRSISPLPRLAPPVATSLPKERPKSNPGNPKKTKKQK